MNDTAAIAGIITATAGLVSAALIGAAKVRASGQQRAARVRDAGRPTSVLPQAPSAHATRAEVEVLERRVADLDADLVRARERLAGCETAVARIQEDTDALREKVHEVNMNAVDRIGKANERLAELAGETRGALSQRGGRR